MCSAACTSGNEVSQIPVSKSAFAVLWYANQDAAVSDVVTVCFSFWMSAIWRIFWHWFLSGKISIIIYFIQATMTGNKMAAKRLLYRCIFFSASKLQYRRFLYRRNALYYIIHCIVRPNSEQQALLKASKMVNIFVNHSVTFKIFSFLTVKSRSYFVTQSVYTVRKCSRVSANALLSALWLSAIRRCTECACSKNLGCFLGTNICLCRCSASPMGRYMRPL